MRADNGYTPLKLNEQNVENNTRRYEYLGGKQPYTENSQRILRGGGGKTESEIITPPGITNQI
jgi:predicted ATP-grasp superfamily ATP-dependent carboligase